MATGVIKEIIKYETQNGKLKSFYGKYFFFLHFITLHLTFLFLHFYFLIIDINNI